MRSSWTLGGILGRSWGILGLLHGLAQALRKELEEVSLGADSDEILLNSSLHEDLEDPLR